MPSASIEDAPVVPQSRHLLDSESWESILQLSKTGLANSAEFEVTPQIEPTRAQKALELSTRVFSHAEWLGRMSRTTLLVPENKKPPVKFAEIRKGSNGSPSTIHFSITSLWLESSVFQDWLSLQQQAGEATRFLRKELQRINASKTKHKKKRSERSGKARQRQTSSNGRR